MAVNKTKAFQTSDGRFFADKKVAELEDVKYQLADALDARLGCCDYQAEDWRLLAQHLMEKFEIRLKKEPPAES